MGTLIEAGSTLAELAPVASWDGDGPGPWIVLVPLLWAVVIVGIVLLARGRWFGRPGGRDGRETAVDVLERRFAEGEIDLEQYRKRRSVLEQER